jgi:hypothetical protein
LVFEEREVAPAPLYDPILALEVWSITLFKTLHPVPGERGTTGTAPFTVPAP